MTSENIQPNPIEKSTIAPWIQDLARTLAVASFGVRVETTGLDDPELEDALGKTAVLAVVRHDSHFNTPVVQTAMWPYVKRIVTVAKEKYFSKTNPQLALQLFNPRWFLLGENLQSQKNLAEAICRSKQEENDDLFLIYPQGTRDNPDTQPIQRGISFIARQAGVPIVPILLSHSQEIIMPKGASVWNGLKSGFKRVMTGRPAIETVAFGSPVDPVKIKETLSPVGNGRQLDTAIMNALAQNFKQLFLQLGQETPPFIDAV